MATLIQTRVARRQEQRSRRYRWWRETGIVVIVALIAALLLRTFVVQTFFIPSGSMEPTLQIGDRILVNKLSYHLHGVDRGNIVVFRRPADENCGGQPVADLVKRVIGLPGETISLTRGSGVAGLAPVVGPGHDVSRPGRHDLQPDEAVQDPGQPLFRHGRQPD